MKLGPSRALRIDQSGATIVEFAMVLPVLCVTILACVDLGYRLYMAAVLQGAMLEGARLATVGGITAKQVDDHVTKRLRRLSADGTIVVVTRSYSDFSGIQKPEKITHDTVPEHEYNKGDCFEDANGNGAYDLDRGRDGLGSADDIVSYSVSINFRRIVPLGPLLGLSDREKVAGTTFLRNQPYAARSAGAPVICP